MKAALQRLKATHAYGSYQRYNAARGGLLAGGIAYFAFFSVFPALTLGFAIFGFVLRGQPSLFHDVVHSISTTLPGIVKDSGHPDGIIDASKPPAPDALTITGAISLVVLVLSGLGWLSALREGIRAMFDQPLLKSNALKSKLRDLGVLALLGLSMLVSAVLSASVNATTGAVLRLLTISSHSLVAEVLLPIAGFVVVLVVDVAIFVVLLRLLSGVQLAWSELRSAALLGAVGSGLIKVAISYGVLGSSTNPLLASFAIVIGLLLVMNLLSRVTLLAAAWAATTRELSTLAAAPAVAAVTSAEVVTGAAAPPRRTTVGVAPAALPHPAAMAPNFGARSQDRTAIAAGAVLGAVATLGLAATRRAAGALISLARR